jgi:glycosyltransferase involved in cell wall biosynthesis
MRFLLKFSNLLPFWIEVYSFFYNLFFVSNKSKLENKESVFFINTHDIGGGAARIALDLFNSNIKNYLAVSINKLHHKNILHIDNDDWSRFPSLFREMEKITGFLDFSKVGPLALLNNKDFQSCELIHLHNLHGFFFSLGVYKTLFKNKKVIWTWHDDFMLTGHCSTAPKCNLWRNKCGNCPDLHIYPRIAFDKTESISKYKNRLLKKTQPIVICPSLWMLERVKSKYKFLNNVRLIYNGIDESIFKPLEKDVVRNKFSISKDQFVILFVAELATKNPFKGGDVLVDLVKNNKLDSTLLITVGDEKNEKYDNHISIAYVSNQIELAELYNLADVLVYPTKADNFPLVVLESMSCGVPVIASNIGGINEIILDGENGYLVDNFEDSNEFLKIINLYKNADLITKNKITCNARTTVIDKFTKSLMIENYTKLYKEIS